MPDAAATGLRHDAVDGSDLSQPADHRLAFRELGLTLGPRAVRHLRALGVRTSPMRDSLLALDSRLEHLTCYDPLTDTIEGSWLEPPNRRTATWREHEDINAVMLATSLAPEGLLVL